MSDFLPTASMTLLALRARMLREVRRVFESEGYLEVETPVLSHDVVVDAHLDPIVVPGCRAARGGDLFLQTSPEFHMKRLLAAGATAIYQIARVMRDGEVGERHNPEFTMVEWYRVGETHHDQMAFTERLVRVLFTPSPLSPAGPGARGVGFERPFERLTYDDAFARFAGEPALEKTPGELAAMAKRLGIAPPPGLAADDRDGWLNLLLAIAVEPHLGRDAPVFLHDYPASQSALAKVRHDPGAPVAERFELYIDGIELCNGYHELTDAAELRRRMELQNAIRRREGLRLLPMRNRLLDAMEAGLPPCAGVALGFDRLMMAVTGAASIAEVIAFPFDRA